VAESLADGSAVGYWTSDTPSLHHATRLDLVLTLATTGGVITKEVPLRVPRTAYQPRDIRTFAAPETFTAGGVRFRLTRLIASSAGVTMEGQYHGGNFDDAVTFGRCPGAIRNCVTAPDPPLYRTGPPLRGWTPFAIDVGPLPPAYLHAQTESVPLRGLLLDIPSYATGVLKRPARTLPYHPLTLTGTGRRLALFRLGPDFAWVDAVGSWTPNRDPFAYRIVIRWSGGEDTGGTAALDHSQSIGGVLHESTGLQLARPLPEAVLSGDALHVTVGYLRLPWARFPPGSVWRPRLQDPNAE
jgi:hypothetical protein